MRPDSPTIVNGSNSLVGLDDKQTGSQTVFRYVSASHSSLSPQGFHPSEFKSPFNSSEPADTSTGIQHNDGSKLDDSTIVTLQIHLDDLFDKSGQNLTKEPCQISPDVTHRFPAGRRPNQERHDKHGVVEPTI